MTDVVWTDAALRDLEAIQRYVGADNPVAALKLARRLYEAGDSLAVFPKRGRQVQGGARELMNMSPYLIRYAFDRVLDRVTIITVWHGAQNEPPSRS